MSSVTEWTYEFLKNKDIFKKEIVSSKKKGNVIEITKKNSVECIISREDYFNQTTNVPNTDKVWVVYDMKPKTPEDIANNWEVLAKQNVWVIVVNLKTHAKWLIHPVSHNKIVEKEQLKASLKSIQSNCN